MSFSIGLLAKDEPMEAVKKWPGPYEHTTITKIVDWEQKVVCYVLTPRIMEQKRTVWGMAINSNNAGSISCVKF